MTANPSRWSVDRPIAVWLEKLGMSEYAQPFAENGIDFGVLPDLTDQDLKNIGVLLGHRRKLLRAIAELNEVEKSPPKAAPPAAATPQDAAERRQVTVMFSDLVGSTALAAFRPSASQGTSTPKIMTTSRSTSFW